MINRKLLYILLGVFFVASVCGVIFHFNIKNPSSLFSFTFDSVVSNDATIVDEGDTSSAVTVESLPLDRDNNTISAESAKETDSIEKIEVENPSNMGDALWEEAKKQDDTVIEVDAGSDAESGVEAMDEKDTASADVTEKAGTSVAEVIGKFTVKNTGLVVRSGPKGTYDALDTLPIDATGEIVEVVNDYWVKIKFGDSEAYICSKYADIEMY